MTFVDSTVPCISIVYHGHTGGYSNAPKITVDLNCEFSIIKPYT